MGYKDEQWCQTNISLVWGVKCIKFNSKNDYIII